MCVGMMENRYLCAFQGCDKAFRRRDRLEIHTRTHTGERPYVCSVSGCPRSYTRSQHLSRHILNFHVGCKSQEPHRCEICNKDFSTVQALQKHSKTLHTEGGRSKSYKCPETDCGQQFHKKRQLVMHRLEHNPHLITTYKYYKCEHESCGKTFSFPNKLKQHQKVHEGHKCEVEGCGELLPNWSSLRKHKAEKHSPIPTCRVCGAVFKEKTNLTQHIKIHATTRVPITCPRDNCRRIFFYERNLRQHIRSFHEGEQVFKKRLKTNQTNQNTDLKKRKIAKRSLAACLTGLDDRGENLRVYGSIAASKRVKYAASEGNSSPSLDASRLCSESTTPVFNSLNCDANSHDELCETSNDVCIDEQSIEDLDLPSSAQSTAACSPTSSVSVTSTNSECANFSENVTSICDLKLQKKWSDVSSFEAKDNWKEALSS